MMAVTVETIEFDNAMDVHVVVPAETEIWVDPEMDIGYYMGEVFGVDKTAYRVES